MPVPSGSFSRLRIGGGFTISNARKSIKPASSGFQRMGQAIRVTSCPATSSMTTCCGSFLPQPRASSVAAGIPMAVTTTISTRMTGTRADGGKLRRQHPPQQRGGQRSPSARSGTQASRAKEGRHQRRPPRCGRCGAAISVGLFGWGHWSRWNRRSPDRSTGRR